MKGCVIVAGFVILQGWTTQESIQVYLVNFTTYKRHFSKFSLEIYIQVYKKYVFVLSY